MYCASLLAIACGDTSSRGYRAQVAAESANTADSRARPDAPELAAQPGLNIQIPDGALSGKQIGATRLFLGIPYAEPPVGPLRFAPPQRVRAWSGTRDAKQYGSACPQPLNDLAANGRYDEDCLTLDVYAPSDVSQRLPVMVFIHGGAFVNGASSQYDALQLAQTPLVLVLINYRLGALGFMSHPSLDDARPHAPSGSDGIRDQQLALRWVRDNIGAFGGDRERVTVFGESAGAISACIHWLAPGSRGLAQRFILESGTCTSDGPGVRDKSSANQLGKQLADALCPGQRDVIACLRAKSAAEITRWGGGMGLFGAGWSPTVEGAGGVLPELPERAVDRAETLAPMIVGTNKHEWAMFQLFGGDHPDSPETLARAISNMFGSKAGEVREHYAAQSGEAPNDVLVRLISDMSFRCPTRTLARLAAGKGAKVWLYSFEQGNAYHGQELDYVFGGAGFSNNFGGDMPAAPLAAAVQRYWTRFAVTGEPNGAPDPTWPQLTAADDAHLVLVDPPVAGHDLAKDACDFWRYFWRSGGTVELR
jgi:para-nitrobenzyl esterase